MRAGRQEIAAHIGKLDGRASSPGAPGIAEGGIGDDFEKDRFALASLITIVEISAGLEQFAVFHGADSRVRSGQHLQRHRWRAISATLVIGKGKAVMPAGCNNDMIPALAVRPLPAYAARGSGEQSCIPLTNRRWRGGSDIAAQGVGLDGYVPAEAALAAIDRSSRQSDRIGAWQCKFMVALEQLGAIGGTPKLPLHADCFRAGISIEGQARVFAVDGRFGKIGLGCPKNGDDFDDAG